MEKSLIFLVQPKDLEILINHDLRIRNVNIQSLEKKIHYF